MLAPLAVLHAVFSCTLALQTHCMTSHPPPQAALKNSGRAI